PGGFSYGDDLSAGRVLATEVNAHLMDDLLEFHNRGGLIIGICNGFQTLVKAGLLPDPMRLREDRESKPVATLFWNDIGKFEDRWITLRVEPGTKCVWTKDFPRLIEYPVAHAEGKFITVDDSELENLVTGGQIVFRYCDQSKPEACKTENVPYPLNPNGSTANIAGICDPSGRVLGLMPHPERFTHPTNHPRWRRIVEGAEKPVGFGESGGFVDGLPLFVNAVNYVREEKGIKV
ncbi:MAG TPA: phosphoribosylformylglycinamidine synthase subunit PurQ, partial [Firmicutes bacterium]|nr:phosphoribosylformylglycinamidine synthase subunit PurQ [Bacillota bacterium]